MLTNIFSLPNPAKLASKQLTQARLQLMEVETALEQHTAAKAALVERIKRLEGYQAQVGYTPRDDIKAAYEALTSDKHPRPVRATRSRRPVVPQPQGSVSV